MDRYDFGKETYKAECLTPEKRLLAIQVCTLARAEWMVVASWVNERSKSEIMRQSGLSFGIWRHVKGGLYALCNVARHSTNGPHDGEIDVRYFSLENQQYCHHALSQWRDQVTVVLPSGSEETAPRFALVEAFPW